MRDCGGPVPPGALGVGGEAPVPPVPLPPRSRQELPWVFLPVRSRPIPARGRARRGAARGPRPGIGSAFGGGGDFAVTGGGCHLPRGFPTCRRPIRTRWRRRWRHRPAMDPLRRLCLCLPLLLLLPAPAAPAPAPVPVPGPNWAACKSLSRELSGLVATLKEPHGVLEDTHLSEEDPKNWPPRIRCSDACDPSNLDTNNTRCLHRILQGLQHYRDLLSSDIFTARRLPPLEAALEQLLGLVQEPARPPRRPMARSEPWAQPLLQRLALQRLQSFSTIMSRVFTHSAGPR
ncbi:interleukin-23 subunit alpha isoform X2 [Pezoporus occidentalis]|uniref:interleukin-23 subunit alpha isoform X2 n=1 Tax=Pezoporus occidentalis TaxID=407982 RepID=UPI002F919584